DSRIYPKSFVRLITLCGSLALPIMLQAHVSNTSSTKSTRRSSKTSTHPPIFSVAVAV
ncbi:unnamed protein product, partial [Dovyalis caffra]